MILKVGNNFIVLVMYGLLQHLAHTKASIMKARHKPAQTPKGNNSKTEVKCKCLIWERKLERKKLDRKKSAIISHRNINKVKRTQTPNTQPNKPYNRIISTKTTIQSIVANDGNSCNYSQPIIT